MPDLTNVKIQIFEDELTLIGNFTDLTLMNLNFSSENVTVMFDDDNS